MPRIRVVCICKSVESTVSATFDGEHLKEVNDRTFYNINLFGIPPINVNHCLC